MLINKNNLMIVKHCAGNESMAFTFCGLRIEKGRTVATDGKIIAVCSTRDKPDSDFPENGTVKRGLHIKEEDGLMISKDQAKRIMQMIPAKATKKSLFRRKALPDPNKSTFALVRKGRKKGTVLVSVAADQKLDIEINDPTEYRFPKWEEYMPKYEDPEAGYFKLSISAKQLLKAAATLNEFMKGEWGAVDLYLPDPSGENYDSKKAGPIGFKAKREDGQALDVMLMLMKEKK